MSMDADNLEELMARLPEDLRTEVRDFVEFLLSKKKTKPGHRLKQGWAGALREYREKYTSLDLQRKALEWRGD